MHKNRRWCVGQVSSAEELAEKLTRHTWTRCTGFELSGYLFLNDSTSEDGGQEYAVVKREADGRFLQLESITFGWCDFDKAIGFIKAAASGEWDQGELVCEVHPQLDTPETHGRCHLCA